ncbi:MAG: signal peptidase I [Acidimicrobiales bacterium]
MAGRRSPLRGAAVEVAFLATAAVVIAVVARVFLAQAFFIPSSSMEPQLEVGDRVVVSRTSYRLHEPRRGDVVVFDCPPRATCPPPAEDRALPVRVAFGALEAVGLRQPSTEEFIKRVVALPGEVVEGRDGRVYVGGRLLVEPYLDATATTSSFDPVKVPDGHLWVMGDNRGNSSDSRAFGVIDQEEVVGRAVLRIWPPTRSAFL